MSHQWIVLKFGGTSVSKRENWDNIANIIHRRQREGKRVFLVASALSGVSNLLESFCQKHKDVCRRIFTKFRKSILSWRPRWT